MTQLSNMKSDEEGVVTFIRNDKKARQRLLDMGLTRGANLRVVNAAPFRGPLEVAIRGTILAIGRGLAEKVFVEIDESDLTYKPHPHGPRHNRYLRG